MVPSRFYDTLVTEVLSLTGVANQASAGSTAGGDTTSWQLFKYHPGAGDMTVVHVVIVAPMVIVSYGDNGCSLDGSIKR